MIGTVLMIGLYVATAIMLVSLGAWPWVVWLWFVAFVNAALVKAVTTYKALTKPKKEKHPITITVNATPDARATADRVADAMMRGLARAQEK